MEFLFVSGHLPSPRGTQGGSKTSYHLSRCLANRHNVHLLSFATDNELATHVESDMSIFHCWDILPVNNWMRLSGVLSSPGLPVSVGARSSREFRTRLRKLLASHHFDIVILDHTALFQYASTLRQVPIVVGCAHDIMTQHWQRRAEAARHPVSRLFLNFEQNRVRRWEAAIFERLDLVLPHSPKDGALAARLQPKAHIFVIQCWLSRLEAQQAQGSAVAPLPNSIVYYGALNRAENVDAATFIASEILPRIRQAVPEAKLYLAGSHGEKLAARYSACPEVVVTGFLPDPIGFLSTMQVALLPLRLGAGIKTKVLECFSAGIPVVTTEVGAEGTGAIAGEHYLLGNTALELAAHTIRLLRDPGAGQRMGTSGREFFFREYDFDRRIAALDSYLEGGLKQFQRDHPMAHSENQAVRNGCAPAMRRDR